MKERLKQNTVKSIYWISKKRDYDMLVRENKNSLWSNCGKIACLEVTGTVSGNLATIRYTETDSEPRVPLTRQLIEEECIIVRHTVPNRLKVGSYSSSSNCASSNVLIVSIQLFPLAIINDSSRWIPCFARKGQSTLVEFRPGSHSITSHRKYFHSISGVDATIPVPNE
jgi:hypothetical protein